MSLGIRYAYTQDVFIAQNDDMSNSIENRSRDKVFSALPARF
jgi:hypothetical protein